jgi:hypothetical protein
VTGDCRLLDNRQPEAGTRSAALSTLLDRVSFRHLSDLGIAA